MLRVLIALTFSLAGLIAGSIWDVHRPATAELVSEARLDELLGGGCSMTNDKIVRCDAAGGTNGCSLGCAKTGDQCVGADTVDNHTCDTPDATSDCTQTNAGNCGTVKTGPIPASGSCTSGCTNAGSGCGAGGSTTTVHTCPT